MFELEGKRELIEIIVRPVTIERAVEHLGRIPEIVVNPILGGTLLPIAIAAVFRA